MFEIIFTLSMTGVICLFLSWLFFVEYQKYRVDVLRYRLFVIRDALFKYASEGKIDFDHPAYGTTRNIINALIYSSEKLSIMRILLLRYFVRKFGYEKNAERLAERFSECQKELNHSQKTFFNEKMYEVHASIFVFLVYKNPFLFPFAMALSLFFRHKDKIESLRKLITTGKAGKEWIKFDSIAGYSENNAYQ